MTNQFNFASQEELRVWLNSKPNEFAKIIALRSALRVFPLVSHAVTKSIDTSVGKGFILQSWRALFTVSLAQKNPPNSKLIKSAYASASAAARSTASDLDSLTVNDISRSVLRATAYAAVNGSAGAAAFAAGYAADAITRTEKGSVKDFWNMISTDCQVLEENGAETLSKRHLWYPDFNSVGGHFKKAPRWLDAPIDNFKNLPKKIGPEWKIITNWYAAQLNSQDDRHDDFLYGFSALALKQEREIILAKQVDRFWTISDKRSAEQILSEAAEMLGAGTKVENQENASSEQLSQFIITFLPDDGSTKSIDDIRSALKINAISYIDSSLRRMLGKLAKLNQIERVNKGNYRKNAKQIEIDIPRQGYGPKLGLIDGKIAFRTLHPDENSGTDFERVEKYLPFIKEALSDFLEATPVLSERNNDPFNRERRQAVRYLKVCETDIQSMDYSQLFGLGSSLMNRLSADSQRSLESDLAPLSDAQRLALEDFQSNHGPMIASTSDGREAIEDAEKIVRNPEEERAFKNTVIEFMEALRDEQGLAQVEVTDHLVDAANEMATGHQEERTYQYGKGAARNAAILVTSASSLSLLTVIGISSGPAGAVICGLLGLAITEATKRSKAFKSVSEPLSNWMDSLSDLDRAKIEELIENGTAKRFAKFTLREEKRIRAMAGNRPEFKWLHDQLDQLKKIKDKE